MPVKQKIALVLQVLEGLSHAHAASIVHRDIKPANIFVYADERVKITDFGVARLAEQTMTVSGIGSPAYMSPEQANKSDVDLRSDLFSVASVTYELFLGRRPFAADTIPGVLYKIAHEEPDFAAFDAGGACAPLRAIVQKALKKDPVRRYQSAREFAEELRRATALFLQPLVPAPSPVATGEGTFIEATDEMSPYFRGRKGTILYTDGSQQPFLGFRCMWSDRLHFSRSLESLAPGTYTNASSIELNKLARVDFTDQPNPRVRRGTARFRSGKVIENVFFYVEECSWWDDPGLQGKLSDPAVSALVFEA